MFSFFERKKNRLVAVIFLVFFITAEILGAFIPQDVYAMPVEDFPLEAEAVFANIEKNIEKIKLTTEDAIRLSVLSAMINGVTYFVRKLAYDTATYVASGGKGQGALVFQEGFANYLAKTGLDTAGEAIGDLGKPFGFNLCNFPDPHLQVFLQIGLRNLYGGGPPTPNCSWQQLKDQWGPQAFENRFGAGAGKYIAERFSANLSVQNSDFGIALNGIDKVDSIAANKVEGAKNQRLEGQGVKAVTDLISGNIKTPAHLVNDDLSQLSAKEQKNLTVSEMEALYGSNLVQIFPMAASVFLNTLASQLLQKLINQGLLPPIGQTAGFDPNFFGAIQANRQAVQDAFNFLKVPNIKQPGDFNIIPEFAACPNHPGLNNCVLDSEFQVAIERAKSVPLTIREAVDEKLLHGDWQIISSRNQVLNTSKDCYRNHYCYSNIQKLRKARVLPIGFEIAALKADPSHPPTLEEVLAGFDKCAPDGRPSTDAQFQWCHLINPNWVLKAPDERCTKLIGPELIDKGPDRREECMDLSTCVLEDPETPGKCAGNFGYCTQEKNIWRLGGKSCEAQYNTCQAYNTAQGGSVAYLSRTVDFGQCSADSAGCRAYSTAKDRDGNWLAASRGSVVYLNDKIQAQTCSPEANGCTALYPATKNDDGTYRLTTASEYMKDTLSSTNTLMYLKKAPDYLGCYDANPATAVVDWPRTSAELRNVSQNPACNAFASVCIPSEVGCESYTPVKQSNVAAIPGKIGNNRCSAECEGYNTFREEATKFATSSFPLYFIPSRGKSCDYAGCDEFTNLDATARGGEGLEYYTDLKYCEKPRVNPANERTFYSWEGSDNTGFVLRVHRLLLIDGAESNYINSLALPGPNVFPVGSPAYDDDSRANLIDYVNKCNADNYALRVSTNGSGILANVTTPAACDTNHGVWETYGEIHFCRATVANQDCRALYDDSGTVYYRLLGNTVTVSEACHPLRKTKPNIFVDPSIAGPGRQGICEQKGGQWNGSDNTCTRCTHGGRYVAGAAATGQGSYCQYQAITEESSVCPAAANLCREYTGNTGNVRESIFGVDTFEPVGNSAAALTLANPAWDTTDPRPAPPAAIPTSTLVRVSSESLRVSEHSLSISSPRISRIISSSKLRSGDGYLLTFWARSNSPARNLAISFVQNVGTTPPTSLGSLSPISLGNTWVQYSLGPVQLNGVVKGVPVYLVFVAPGAALGAGSYFIDNVELVRTQDKVRLVKDSWKTPQGYDVPLACNSRPDSGFPGQALGCTQYKDSQGKITYATGFEALCRPQAVGCSPVYDTHNTLAGDGADRLQAYNVWCAGSAGTCALTVDSQRYTCNVLQGEAGCYIAGKVIYSSGARPAAENIRPSTIIIPEDTSTNTPLFLANRTEFQCRSREVGCQLLGREQPVPHTGRATHSDVYFINNPDNYGTANQPGTLCRQELLGCNKYTSDKGEAYFKDPTITGGGVCSYRKKVRIGSTDYDGWFKDGVGHCSQNNDACVADADCNVAGATGNRCVDIGNIPCYSDYLRRTGSGLIYGIRSNRSDPGYAGRAGLCPAEKSSCTEFVDPADTSQLYPQGHPYYALFNNEIKNKIEACTGKVSQTAGCVLFDQTSNPNKLYRSDLTYAASARSNPPYGPVTAIPAPQAANNDSNIILKVDRDRACSEWLACKSATIQAGPDGNPLTLCYDYRPCDATRPGENCTHWAPRSGARLNEDAYIRRNTSWGGTEYSGYSIFDKYQIGDLVYVRFNLEAYDALKRDGLADSSYAAYPMSVGDSLCNRTITFTGTTETSSTDWNECGPTARPTGGRCYGNRCLTAIDASIPGMPDILASVAGRTRQEQEGAIRGILPYFVGGSCKAFPEKDSPFPLSVNRSDLAETMRPRPDNTPTPPVHRRLFTQKKELFEQANVCQEGNCSCGYRKIGYKGAGTDYWPVSLSYSEALVPRGVCVGGMADGNPCIPNASAQCGAVANPPPGSANANESVCNPIDKKEIHVGLEGYCLERDISRPINGLANFANNERQQYACLTWLPIDVSASNFDLLNTYVNAGYNPDVDAVNEVNGNRRISGKIYCPIATGVGGRVNASGDDNLTEATALGWETRNFSPGSGTDARRPRPSNPPEPDIVTPYFFRSDGLPNIPANHDCTHDESQFVSRVCRNGSPYDNISLYNLMQSWSWRILGPNAVVLRVESGKLGRREGRAEDQCGGNQCATIYHFFPCRTCGDDHHNFGTIMHPPRNWGQLDTTAQQELIRQSIYRTVNTDAGLMLDAAPLAPFPEFSDLGGYSNNIADSVNRFSSEGRIRTTDVNRIYFVPMEFPPDTLGIYPHLLTRDLYIDFNVLDRQSGPGRMAAESHAVPALYHHHGFGRDLVPFPAPIQSPWQYGGDGRGNYTVCDLTDDGCDGMAPGQIWTYKLQRGAPGFFSFDTYRGSASYNNDRNQIWSRYVLVFSNRASGHTPPFMPSLNPPPGGTQPTISVPIDAQHDPLSVECNRQYDNWFAIGMDFNRDGEFLGYISRYCHGFPNNQDGAMVFSTIATLADQCTEFSQVYRSGIGDTNKAWTNRVWQNSFNQPITVAPTPLNHPSPGYSLFPRFRPNRPSPSLSSPFGSLLGQQDELNISDTNVLDSYTFRYDEFGDINNPVKPDGIPYSCSDRRWNNLPILSRNMVCASLNGPLDSPPPMSLLQSVISGKRYNEGYDALYQLFANIFNINTRTGVTPQRQGNLDLSGTDLAALSRTPPLQPPQIYSLNPVRCFAQRSQGSGGSEPCIAGEANNFTVNEKNYTLAHYDGQRNGPATEDPRAHNYPDAIIGQGSITAQVQFFAFADDNRMPMRRIRVNWGDGEGDINSTGLYKNHKPFCSTTDNGRLEAVSSAGICGSDAARITGLTCRKNADCPLNADAQPQTCWGLGAEKSFTSNYSVARFGNASRACTTEPFRFSHDYSCPSSISAIPPTARPSWVQRVADLQTSNPDAYDRLHSSYHLTDNDVVCVFRPRVQVTDNWGWCNGLEVDEITPRTQGYWNDSPGHLCNQSNLAWTPYRGNIVVVPSQ